MLSNNNNNSNNTQKEWKELKVSTELFEKKKRKGLGHIKLSSEAASQDLRLLWEACSTVILLVVVVCVCVRAWRGGGVGCWGVGHRAPFIHWHLGVSNQLSVFVWWEETRPGENPHTVRWHRLQASIWSRFRVKSFPITSEWSITTHDS